MLRIVTSNNVVTHWHGGCYAQHFSLSELLALPREETGKLTLDDIGVETMKAILDAWSDERAKGPQ